MLGWGPVAPQANDAKCSAAAAQTQPSRCLARKTDSPMQIDRRYFKGALPVEMSMIMRAAR